MINVFESREDKKAREMELQKQAEERRRQEREEELRLRQEKIDKENKEFMDDLHRKSVTQKIINLWICHNRADELRDMAMNFLIVEKDFVCVQNDMSCTKYSAHFALTFVRKDYAKNFLNQR